MSDLNFMRPAKKNNVTFQFSPLYNFFCSLSCLNQDLEGLTGWLPGMKSELPEKLLKDCHFYTHPALLLYDNSVTEMKDYLDQLEEIEPEEMIRLELDALEKKYKLYLDTDDFPEREELMNDRQVYRDVIEKLYSCKGMEFDSGLTDREFDKFGNTAEFKSELINFVRTMWDYYFESEWNKEADHVQSSVDAFNSLNFGNKSVEEIVKQIIERDEIPEIFKEYMEKGLEIIFIPSPHIGPYLLLIHDDEKTMRIMTRARIPEGAVTRSLSMERSELLMKLNGLSDDTRLQILRMASGGEAVTTQMVMDELKLSQSSASRHLNQLTAIGFLAARPEERVKRYKINRSKIDSVFKLLNDFLRH
jgi:DNA-binding transcriptional ArsR family regulator